MPARELPRQHPRHHSTALAVREPDLSAAEGLDDDRQGYPVTVRLRLSSRARVTIRRALRARKRMVAQLHVRVVGDAGNARTLTRQVTLRL